MTRKERLKRKKIIRAYTARAIAAFILITMIVLMFCGCLYIRDLFRKDDANAVQSGVSTEEDSNIAKEDDDVVLEDTIAPEDLEPEYKQYPGISIVLDPGHGGNDGGTTTVDMSTIEKNVNLEVSKYVGTLLEKHGVNVIYTRQDDDYMSLEERAYFSSQQAADLFVSLHCNFFEGDESIDGLEAFYCKNAENSRVFAECIAAEVSAQDEIELRGATENNYYVTRHAGTEAILIEMGFLSNPVESAKLASPEYQELLAETIVNGILAAFDSQN